MSTVLAPPTAPPSSPKTSRKKSAQRISSRTTETQKIYDAYSPSHLKWKNVDWTVAVFLTFVHLGAIAAPFFFSWSGLAAFFLLHWLTASIGVCLGYHRYLAHRSMKLRKPAEFFTMMCGTISGEGTPFMWSATHRLHHNRSDQEGDPHSPLDGSFWSHLLWLFVRHSPEHSDRLYKRYIPELLDRPMLKFFERTQGFWLLGTGLLLGGIGLATGGLFGAISMILWGFCLRMVVVYHGTWCVNSATHIWGYKNYKTRDESRNLWWVAILAYGEGWHNNHHAHPSVARAGHKWWEVDLTWWSIRALEMVGQAYDVDRRIPCREQANPTQANEDSE
jgi:stearoyl-CoA desaturase (delta-9 desaturase)